MSKVSKISAMDTCLEVLQELRGDLEILGLGIQYLEMAPNDTFDGENMFTVNLRVSVVQLPGHHAMPHSMEAHEETAVSLLNAYPGARMLVRQMATTVSRFGYVLVDENTQGLTVAFSVGSLAEDYALVTG